MLSLAFENEEDEDSFEKASPRREVRVEDKKIPVFEDSRQTSAGNVKYMPISLINRMKDPESEKLSLSLKKRHQRPHSQLPKKAASEESEQCPLAFSACAFAKRKLRALEEGDKPDKRIPPKRRSVLPKISRQSVSPRENFFSKGQLGMYASGATSINDSPVHGSKLSAISRSNLKDQRDSIQNSVNRNKLASAYVHKQVLRRNTVRNSSMGLDTPQESPNHASTNQGSPNHGQPRDGLDLILINQYNSQNLVEKETSCWDGIILFENYSEQAEVILKHLEEQNKIRRNRDLEKKIFNRWIRAIPREEREEKFFAELEKEVGCFTRYLPMSEVKKDMEKVFGIGEKRRLRPGEEAAIIEVIIKMLKECLTTPELMLHSVSALTSTILKRAKLENLSKFQFCFKQTECHWKIMATRFRCSGASQFETKRFEKVFSSSIAKSHFYNLNQTENTIVKYLLKYSDRLQPNLTDLENMIPTFNY